MEDERGRRVRTKEPVREQTRFVFDVPDEAIPPSHPARMLWRIVETLDLGRFVASAKAVEGVQGRDVLSVRMLLTLWLYGVSEGIGSAREIERRLQTDAAFRWIAGGVSVGRTKLAEFRVAHREALDRVLTDVLATLMHKDLLPLTLVAQDGTRIRASASAPSFRRLGSLEECREQARLHVHAVLVAGDDPELTERVKRAREAAARDYERRVTEAIAVVQELESGRLENRKKKPREAPRASTTDPDARVMKMPDGGFRPAYNVQLATAGAPLGGPRTIVGVRVTNVGSDMNSVAPMLDDVQRRTGELPDKLLADANHATLADLEEAAKRGVEALIAVPDRMRKPGDNASYSDAIVDWRRRMATPEAKETFRARASLCELPNAQLKSRLGLGRFLVRGLDKVTCAVLLATIASNLLAHASGLLT